MRSMEIEFLKSVRIFMFGVRLKMFQRHKSPPITYIRYAYRKGVYLIDL